MNTHFEELLGLLGVTEQKLLKALYIVRAPRSLVAIVPLCQAFMETIEEFPILSQMPNQHLLRNPKWQVVPEIFEGQSFAINSEEYAEGLELLGRIAVLQTDEEHFSGRCLEKRKNKWTPLRPYTGDSVIGELLLVTTAKQDNQEYFSAVAAWLIRQVQYFHFQRLSLGAYEQYMLGDESRLKDLHHGGRPYTASLSLKELAASKVLGVYASMFGALDEKTSFKLALLASFDDASTKTERKRLAGAADSHFSLANESLDSLASETTKLIPRSWQLLLFSIWEKHLHLITRPGGGGGSVSGRHVESSEIVYGSVLTEALMRTGDEGDGHAGIVDDFFERAKTVDDPESDDPGEEEQCEPVFSLYLSDQDDLLLSFYASKSIQSSVELQNAQLPWTRYLLSSEAVREVLNHVTKPFNCTNYYEVLARLGIALSLITGRAIEELVEPVITETDEYPTAKSPVVINKTKSYLLLFAARPKLADKHLNVPFCYQHQEYIVLPLPKILAPLVQTLQVGQNKRRVSVVRLSKKILKNVPSQYRVTSKSLRNTFIQVLLNIAGGDLGLQKVITDGNEANTQNIIHYAS